MFGRLSINLRKNLMATKQLTADPLVSVVCIDPIRFNGKKYAPGSTITGLTTLQANALVAGNHAELMAAAAAAADVEGEGAGTDTSTTPAAEASTNK